MLRRSKMSTCKCVKCKYAIKTDKMIACGKTKPARTVILKCDECRPNWCPKERKGKK